MALKASVNEDRPLREEVGDLDELPEADEVGVKSPAVDVVLEKEPDFSSAGYPTPVST
jgi:hypothetical protein